MKETAIEVARKRYLVIHEGDQIIRINFVNAQGERPLAMTSQTAKAVIKAFHIKIKGKSK